MSYRELQQTLKAYRAQGYEVPKLNSKKAVLEAALHDIWLSEEIAISEGLMIAPVTPVIEVSHESNMTQLAEIRIEIQNHTVFLKKVLASLEESSIDLPDWQKEEIAALADIRKLRKSRKRRNHKRYWVA